VTAQRRPYNGTLPLPALALGAIRLKARRIPKIPTTPPAASALRTA
jgi:hypothetical protein